MPDPSVEKVLDRVTNMEKANAPLFERMDNDWDLYNLKEFIPMAGEGIRREDAYTSNRPKIVADKLVGSIAAAKLIVRVEVDANNEAQRDANNDFERLAIGMLKKADKRRETAGGTRVQTELGFRAITSGGYVAARALLLKDEDGNTVVDVTPVIPRHLLIQMGVNGPIWAAIVTLRTRYSIRDEYPKFRFEGEDDLDDDANRNEKVIDYYWRDGKRFMNAVIVNRQFAKRPADTFAVSFPIVARAVGAHSGTPGLRSLSEDTPGMHVAPGVETFAESIFAPLRANNRFKNRLMSYRMTMAAKSVRQIQVVESSGGTRELSEAVDEDATEINLDIDNNEKVYPLEVRELTRDVDALSGFVSLEDADGSLPEQAFGRLPAPISGNALRILGSSVAERLEPFIRPVESCLEGIIEALAGQFETGRYKEIQVSGKTRDRLGFNRPVKPADIKGHDSVIVQLEPDLPTDRQEQWITANLAVQPGADGIPLASHITAREDILKLQDADLENERIFAQKARTSSEKMVLMMQLVAATRQGDTGTVEFLQKELQRIITDEAMQEVAKRLAFMQLIGQSPLGAAAQGMGGGEAGSNGSSPDGSGGGMFAGIRPEAQGLTGVAPGSVEPSPEAGANTTAPRSAEQRANDMGITLARR
jgi:hypothetical protein